MPPTRKRTPAELTDAMRQIRAEADRHLARKAATVEAWTKFKAELEDRDAAMRIILAAAANDRAALNLRQQSKTKHS